MKTNDLCDGMLLKSDLISPFGDVLLKKGTRLSTKHIRFIHNWGLTDIDAEDVYETEEIDPEKIFLFNILNELDDRFMPFAGNETMTEIKQKLHKFITEYIEK